MANKFTVPAGFRNKMGLLWTPSEIVTDAWYDAADAATITESGGAVSQWSDKSGNDYHVTQATGSKQPTTGTRTINGLNVLDYNRGSVQELFTSSHQFTNEHSIFAVGFSDVSTSYGRMITTELAQPTLFFGRYNNSTNFSTFYHNGVGFDDLSANTNPSGPVNVSAILELVADGAGVSQPYYNGVAQDAKTCTLSTADGLSIGGRFSQNWDGVIAEVLIFDRAVTDTERQLIEGYLAHKWSLTAGLPAGHPYKVNAPRA